MRQKLNNDDLNLDAIDIWVITIGIALVLMVFASGY